MSDNIPTNTGEEIINPKGFADVNATSAAVITSTSKSQQKVPNAIFFGEQTPAEIAKKNSYDSLNRLWKTLTVIAKFLGVVITIVIVILSTTYSYHIANIAEPMGELKADVKNLQETNRDLKNRIDNFDQNIVKLLGDISDTLKKESAK